MMIEWLRCWLSWYGYLSFFYVNCDFGTYCFLEVFVVDDDYEDDFNDDDLWMMMNSYMQNDDDIDDEID